MSDQNNAVVSVTSTLTDGVSVKVADSRKCISIYGIAGRMPINFTREQWELFRDNFAALDEFYRANSDQLLTREERKAETHAKKSDAKLMAKQAQIDEAKVLQLALQLAKAMNKA